mgnify:CR=1 FL=1
MATSSDQAISDNYESLRRIAAAYFRSQPAGHTLQPTALVHEAFLRADDEEMEMGVIGQVFSPRLKLGDHADLPVVGKDGVNGVEQARMPLARLRFAADKVFHLGQEHEPARRSRAPG